MSYVEYFDLFFEPICYNKSEMSMDKRYIFSSNTQEYLDQTFFFQIIVVSLTKTMLEFLLKPFGFTPVVAQMLCGHIIGATGFASNKKFKNLIMPDIGLRRTEIVGAFGLMVYVFLIGVKIDLSTILRSTKKAWIIGLSTFLVPIVFTVPLALICKDFFIAGEDNVEYLGPEIPMVAVLTSITSCHVISCLLGDLKILNTNLGRLATSVSTISGICSWVTFVFFSTLKGYSEETVDLTGFIFSTIVLVVFITKILRKVVVGIIKKTPEGEPINVTHLFIIFLMIPGTGFIGQCVGIQYWVGPMILGLAIPDGPPIGSALTDKLESLVSALFLPLYFLNVGNMTSYKYWEIDVYGSKHRNWTILFILLGFLGKLAGTFIPCLFYQMPLRDAAMLGTIMTTLGLFDVLIYLDSLNYEYIDRSIFTTLVYNALIVAAVTSTLVHWFYNPSRKYIIHKNRTIQNVKHNSELRILVSIYNENNVHALINLLEASNPNRKSPLYIYLLHLIELHGRSTPLLTANKQHDKNHKSTPSNHIVNRFKIFEKQNQGVVVVHPYTAITPFVSAHEDICTMALDKNVSLTIIPFHKQWHVDGVTESSKCRIVNKKILDKAPCSVGVLIDRGSLNNVKSVLACWSTYVIGVIFLGGPDDREALFYAKRMAEHSNIYLSVHRLLPINFVVNNMKEKILDDNLINEYRLQNVVNGNSLYKEQVLKDGIEIVHIIQEIENSYDLIIVGRHQDNYSSLFFGLVEWNEFPEIGFFGDMFASSDFKGNCRILVVQQHSCVSSETTISVNLNVDDAD